MRQISSVRCAREKNTSIIYIVDDHRQSLPDDVLIIIRDRNKCRLRITFDIFSLFIFGGNLFPV